MGRDDLSAVWQMHQRSLVFDEVPQTILLEELETELDDVHVVLESDTRAAYVEGELAGYIYTYHLPSEECEERCLLFGTVEPRFRRRGVGTALMRWALARSQDQLLSSGRNLPRFVRLTSLDRVEGVGELCMSVGMNPVRYGEVMLRSLTDLPPLHVPDGVRIVPWPVERNEEILLEKNLSFADHWGSTPTSAALWEQCVSGPGTRVDLSFVAMDENDKIIGHMLNMRFENDDAVLGRSDGWLENLGILSEWRGRGVGGALIIRSLYAFLEAGCTHASLGVDGANPTGAVALYKTLGFETDHRSTTYELSC